MSARVEDAPLVRGAGCYTDDLVLPRQVHALMLRSPHAHARILGIDAARARGMPGVLAVFTHADLAAAGIGRLPSLPPLKSRDGSDRREPLRHALAREVARHVGDPVACVVAETLAQARDAGEQVAIDYEPLPAVADGRAALAPDAPELGTDVPGNCLFDWETGDAAGAEALFRAAHHVVSLTAHNQRVIANPLETRAVNAAFDAASGRFTVHAGTQGVHMLRNLLAQAFGLPVERFRVVTGDVGGAFGPKYYFYPEQILCTFAARHLGRPVKWTADRAESFLSDSQGRDLNATLELALDAGGRMLALRMDAVVNLGAYLSTFAPVIPAPVATAVLPSVYRFEAVYARVRGATTNTVPVDAYRGSGKPEIHFLVERLIDRAALETGIDRVELRRRNLLPAAAMPWRNALGVTYDSGDFPAMLEHAISESEWATAAARKAAALQRGKLHGIGLACYIESTGGARAERAEIRFDGDGDVTVLVGTQSSGQGHVSAYRALVASHLQVAPERVRVVQGDSDQAASGGGTGGSRSLSTQGTALMAALALVAAQDREGGVRRDVVAQTENPAHNFPNGCHVAELEIDPDTGAIELLRYTVADDFGNVLQPVIVTGQVHGGAVQGIGQALLEHAVYDAGGQLLSGSLMDYGMPRAHHIPPFAVSLHGRPCTTNPLGVKGAGEAGAVGSAAAVINAVVDALSGFGVTHIEMPATPARVWQAIQAAR